MHKFTREFICFIKPFWFCPGGAQERDPRWHGDMNIRIFEYHVSMQVVSLPFIQYEKDFPPGHMKGTDIRIY